MTRHDDERRGTVLALRTTARRIEFLTDQCDELEVELGRLVRSTRPSSSSSSASACSSQHKSS
jgi:hypothetical protein